MEIKIFIIIAILFIGVLFCSGWLCYTIGFLEGMKKMKQIDDDILESKGIIVD